MKVRFGTYELKSKIIKGHLAVGNELIDSADYQVLPYLVQKLQTKLYLKFFNQLKFQST